MFKCSLLTRIKSFSGETVELGVIPTLFSALLLTAVSVWDHMAAVSGCASASASDVATLPAVILSKLAGRVLLITGRLYRSKLLLGVNKSPDLARKVFQLASFSVHGDGDVESGRVSP